MANESYQDVIRRTMGLQTSVEREAQAAERVRREKELEDDQPRRQALILQCKNTAWLAITKVFNETKEVVGEAGLQITEVNQPILVPDILTQRSFQVSRARQGQFPHLQFQLLSSGQVNISATDLTKVSGSAPVLPIAFKSRNSAFADLSEPEVQEVFRDYIQAITETRQQISP
jgi:hypothetical protein